MTATQGFSRDENRSQLRHHAEGLLRDGGAATTGISGGILGVEALELLYRQASNPEFAADALKLLHELQTHQVELDLVLSQVQASETEVAEELAYYRALYQRAPVAYLVTGRDGQVLESNEAAGTLLGLAPGASPEQTLMHYLLPENRPAVMAMVQTLAAPGSTADCLVRLAAVPGCQLIMNASPGPSAESVLLTLSPIPATDADAAWL